MKALLIALTMLGNNPHAEQAPSLSVEPRENPQIISAFIREHDGRMYLCGMAVHHPEIEHQESRRFVFFLEGNWRIYEPTHTDNEDVWQSWNETYSEICEAD